MMKLGKGIIFSGLISIIAALLVVFLLVDSKKQGYIDMVKLNEQFELKLSLQKELDKELNKGHLVLDNLELEMQSVYNDSSLVGNDRFTRIKQLQTDIEMKTYEYTQNEQELTKKYNKQIWTQLNVYLKQYGKEKDIDILFGAAGQGTILYGKDEYNLTEECIAFVNKKYRGE